MATAGPGGPWVGYQDREGRPCWYNPATGEWTYDLTATGYTPKAPQAPQAPQAHQAMYMGGATPPAMMMAAYGGQSMQIPQMGMQIPQMGMPTQQPMMPMQMPNPQGGAMYLQPGFPGQVMQGPQPQHQLMPPQQGHMMQQQPGPGQPGNVNGWVGSHPLMASGALLAGGALLGAAVPYAGQYFTGQGSPAPPQPFPVAPGTPQGQQAWLFPAGMPGVVPGTMPTPMKGKHDGGGFMGGLGGSKPYAHKQKGGGKEKKKENGLPGGDELPTNPAAAAAMAAAAAATAAAAAAAAEPETAPGSSDLSQQAGQPPSPEKPGMWERTYDRDGGRTWRHSSTGIQIPYDPYL